MANPGDLIRIFADALKVPLPTVGAYYRTLREAGLVTKGGRGRSSPASTPEDAALLLAALLGSDTGVDAGDAALRFSAIVAVADTEVDEGVGLKLVAYDMSAFLDDNFVGAIARMLRTYDQIVAEVDRLKAMPLMRVQASQTAVTGTIQISGSIMRFVGQELSWLGRPGMVVMREVHADSLATIAAAFRPVR